MCVCVCVCVCMFEMPCHLRPHKHTPLEALCMCGGWCFIPTTKPPNLIHLLSTVFRHLIDAYSCNISFGGREVGSSSQTNSHHVQGKFSEAYVAIAWRLFPQRMVAATPTALCWQNTPAPTHAFLSLTEAHSDTAARSLP